LVANGRIYDFVSHLERFEQGLKAARIALDTKNIESICNELIAKNNVKNGYVRFAASRGEASCAVGYLPKASAAALLIQTSEKPYPGFTPLKLFTSTYLACSQLPAKTNSSLIYTLAMMQASDHGCD